MREDFESREDKCKLVQDLEVITEEFSDEAGNWVATMYECITRKTLRA